MVGAVSITAGVYPIEAGGKPTGDRTVIGVLPVRQERHSSGAVDRTGLRPTRRAGSRRQVVARRGWVDLAWRASAGESGRTSPWAMAKCVASERVDTPHFT